MSRRVSGQAVEQFADAPQMRIEVGGAGAAQVLPEQDRRAGARRPVALHERRWSWQLRTSIAGHRRGMQGVGPLAAAKAGGTGGWRQ